MTDRYCMEDSRLCILGVRKKRDIYDRHLGRTVAQAEDAETAEKIVYALNLEEARRHREQLARRPT